MYSFSLLVNSFDLDTFLNRLKLTYTVFKSQGMDSDVAASIEKLQNLFEILGVTDDANDVDFVEPVGDEEDIIDESDEFCASNPFLYYIKDKLSDAHLCSDNQNCAINSLYNPHWTNILESKWLPHTPLWTSLLRGMH